MAIENFFAEERKSAIVEYVNKHSKATVSELCDFFNVSPATVRNDLKDLAVSGLLSRVHGGAIANVSVSLETQSQSKQELQITEKRNIANAALNHIHEGDFIALDAGSTTFELASRLTEFQNLTVVTFDLNIANWLDQNTNVNVILAGGPVRKGLHYITGNFAINTIKDLHVDIAFIAANGVSPEEGLTTSNIDTANIKKVMIDNARKVVLMADSQKLGSVSFVKFADLNHVDYFITDFNARQEDIHKIELANVKVELVPASL